MRIKTEIESCRERRFTRSSGLISCPNTSAAKIPIVTQSASLIDVAITLAWKNLSFERLCSSVNAGKTSCWIENESRIAERLEKT